MSKMDNGGMKKRGRKSTYTKVAAAEICDRLAAGEPMRSICRDEHMPQWQTVYRWMANNEEFSNRIARARELGFDAIAEQCIDIADDERHDWVTTKKGVIIDEVAIGRARLQVDTRLKLLAKWSPKKYGDKQDINLTGQIEIAAAIVAARKRSGR